MDGLSVAASIAGVMGLADIVFRQVFKYAKAVKNAKKDIEGLASELGALSGILHHLSIVTEVMEEQQDKPDDPGAFRMQHVESCYHILSTMKLDLEGAQSRLHGANKLDSIQQRLVWPLTSSKTKHYMAEIGRHKQTMTLALSADSMAVLLKLISSHEDTNKRVGEIQTDVRRTLDISVRIVLDARRRQVLDFFMRYDVHRLQQSFETSVKLRQPFTGLWLIHGDAFKNWLSTAHSNLWLSGIPGAGKTVLAGAMIEEARNLSNLSCGVAYFFCDSTRGNTASLIELLGALVWQLAHQNYDAYGVLDNYFGELHPEHLPPRVATTETLVEKLSEMADMFDRVLIIVDGIDEYGDMAGDVIQCLKDVSDNSEACSMALISRDEPQIREHLEENFTHVAVAAQKGDVELFARADIDRRIRAKKLRFGPNSHALKEEIIQALIDGSEGM
jgi:hypothetical protein